MKHIAKLLFFIVVFTNCQSQKVNQTSNTKLYKKSNNELKSQFIVYHINDSVSELHYSIDNDILIYTKTDTSTFFYSHLTLIINCNSTDNLNNTEIKNTFTILDKQTEVNNKLLTGSVQFKLYKNKDYLIEINTIDEHKKTQYTANLLSDKTSNTTRQNFLITTTNNQLNYSNFYRAGQTIFLQSNRNFDNQFTVDYFDPNFKMALPPFVTEQMQHFNYKPDSTFTVTKLNQTLTLNLPDKGFLHLKTDEKTKNGVSFFVYESAFPKIKNAEQMILATRYIMAKKEFDNCINASDKKNAIDKFWLGIAGSNERAKELIKKYYNRIQDANKLFSSYQEGWKTDRGMIYTVFGAPNKVTKQKNGEYWQYGEANTQNATTFVFIKVINPFTDNDLYLERNESFKLPWYQAVDMWRQGRIYLDN